MPDDEDDDFEDPGPQPDLDPPGRWTTDLERLADRGVALPSPEKLSDEALTAKLWEVVRAMAAVGSYLFHTDHLSDRELYTWLYEEGLLEDLHVDPELEEIHGGDGAWFIDLISGGSEQDHLTWLTYYASAKDRADDAKEFGAKLPPRKKLPYDRDRHLPKHSTIR